MVLEAAKSVGSLVVDAGPIFKVGLRVKDYADEFYTVPEVFNEIRDRQSRQLLALFPFEIKVRVPSEEALKAVIAFAKKTGDYAALSGVDLKVLALTYMIEKEKCGIEHLRKEPVKAQVQLGSKSPEQLKAEKASAESKGNTKVDTEPGVSKEGEYFSNFLLEESSETSITEELEKLTVSEKEPCSSDVPAVNEESEDDASDSDDGDWITPSNLKEKQLESMGHLKRGETKVEMRKVGCITTDYAMQSVILQMNLALVSVEGMMIKDLRSFVLRCHACFKITANLTKQFCPSCGGPTLIRTSCSVDQDGNVKYYLKKNFRHNLRGIKYSIPNPKGGHKNTDLILREDTKEYERAMKNYNHRKETNLFDPDYLPGILTGKHLPNSLPPTIGFGRKNPNQARRCKGRKKS